MKISTHYKKINPTSGNGYAIQVITTYSSFNEEEIKRIEDLLKDSVSALTIVGSQRIVQSIGIQEADND